MRNTYLLATAAAFALGATSASAQTTASDQGATAPAATAAAPGEGSGARGAEEARAPGSKAMKAGDRAKDRSAALEEAKREPAAFARKAAMSNMLEIRSSEIALERAQRPEVRQFAQQMVSDHSNASERLQTIATTQNLVVPAALDEKHQNKIQRISTGEVAQFDRNYMELQVEAHENAVELFRGYSEQGREGELKQFASQTLPTLQQHLTQAEQIRDRLDEPAGADQAQVDPLLDTGERQ